MRYATDRPFGYGTLKLRTDASRQRDAVCQLQQVVLHHREREIYVQKVEPNDVYKDPLPRSTWYVKVRVTKHDPWVTIASGIGPTQAEKALGRLREARYEGRPLYAVRIGREVK